MCDLPLAAAVHVGAMLDGDHGDDPLVVVDRVDRSVVTASRRMKPLKPETKRCTGPSRVLGYL